MVGSLKNIDQSKLYISSPNGIDVPINRLQKRLIGLDWVSLAFGRTFNNDSEEGTFPEAYIGKNEYLEVSHDDALIGHCFFTNPENRDINNGKALSTLKIIFHVNLSKALTELKHRATEEILSQAINVVKRQATVTGVSEGVSNVYSDYSKILKQNLVDMQPHYVFALEVEMYYEFNCSC